MDLIVISSIIGGIAYYKNLSNIPKNTPLIENMLLDTPDVPKYNRTVMVVPSKEEEYTDLNRELKGICTDIVVQEFFKSDDTLYQFLNLVYTEFEGAIREYKKIHDLEQNDIFFTFKGGNILRLVYKELILELPNNAAKNIMEFYKKYFKRSDADFSVYINPHLENYDKIFNDWCNISYYLQDKIRNTITENTTTYFDYFKYNKEYTTQILKKHLIHLQNADSLTNPENTDYYGSKIHNIILLDNTANKPIKYDPLDDFMIEFGDIETNLIRHDIAKTDSIMYISLNKALEFSGGNGELIKFALVRTKINFNLLVEHKHGTRKINMGGELIDVSLPHKDDLTTYEVFKNYNKSIARYTIHNDEESFEFNSYSLDFLIHDLENILFHQEQYPWDNNKYVKRLNRVCYLYFMVMLIQYKSNIKRQNTLQSIILNIIKDNGEIEPLQGDHPADNIQEFNRILWYYKKTKLKTNLQMYKEEFNEFKTTILKNLNELLKGFDSINTYCTNGPGNIDLADIYDSNVDELV